MKKILKLSSFFVALSPDGTAKFPSFRYSDELLGPKEAPSPCQNSISALMCLTLHFILQHT